MVPPGLALSLPLLSFVVALVVVRAAIAYAHRRGMLDQPGQRRSHTIPTPRGGGIGIVLATLLGLPIVAMDIAPDGYRLTIAAIWLGLLLVAWTGWWDDHRPLPVAPRLVAQAAGTGLVVLAMWASGEGGWWLPLLLLAGIGSINLHNFMDGIDGLLAQQAVFVMAGLAAMALALDEVTLAAVALMVGSATAGFWVYNRPPARIFMGDVGSGALGFLVFALGAALWRVDAATFWPTATVCSAFLTDAGMTLLVRVWRGRRWYSAHREHLYQWLVRGGRTHGMVSGRYAAWNLIVCAPASYAAWRMGKNGWVVFALVFGVSVVVWIALKRACLQRARERMS
ncbi:MAG: glycosyl transferase family 4 [Lysobacterales bacterium 14-68-21]|jgi:UDP-N-acetylmuramyl pentapeptide phosphotransferase/UDP-N-acetylglucosamine-1-phosphate transferase|nr:MAG: glycosyl transferase family 4 [Xanthomonadales bacterium 15-68-25]OZB66802.1 MAG: glycosyl transferase family 4 [Xanthomonadales bacterium 14-68-21]